jgi:hypothetical protein
MLAVTAALIFHETRGTTIWFDEWSWVLDRRGSGLGTLLEPHNGHFSLVPVLLYKALFATAGIDDYTPYRVMVVAGHLGCAVLLYAYAAPRIGPFAALLPTALLLLLGPAWQNFVWPFQIAWLISLAAGIGALLALDHGDRRGDAVACALLALALASSGIGIAIGAGLVVEVLWRRRPVWVVAAPVALYGLWWLVYQDTDFFRHNVTVAPQFAAEAAGGALAAVAGLTEARPDANGVLIDAGAALAWGRPLFLAAVAVLIWRLAALRPVPVRVFTLLAMAAAFWLLGGLQRAQISSPDASRYLYVGALFVLLIVVELVRGVRVGRWVAGLMVALTSLAVVSNVGDLRAGARNVRSQADDTRADLAALVLARDNLPPDYLAAGFPGVPFVEIDPHEYFAAARELGSVADSTAELAAAPEQARLVADGELANIEQLVPRPTTERPGATPPAVDVVTAGQVRTHGGCVNFRPDAAVPGGAAPELQVTLPAGGLLLTAQGGRAGVSVRRFAATFPRDPSAWLTPGSPAVLRPRADRAPQPWHVRLTPEARVSACGLRTG